MGFKGTLYPFQIEAKEKMVDKGQLLLAVVMGGGKTVIINKGGDGSTKPAPAPKPKKKEGDEFKEEAPKW